jgi:hypothetical protein
MKIGLALVVTFIWAMVSCFAQDKTPAATSTATLADELKRLNIREALVLPYEVGSTPRWSPKGDALVCKINGKWLKVDLNHLHLSVKTWHGKQKVGIVNSKDSYAVVGEKEIKDYKPFSDTTPRKAILKNGTIITLNQEKMSTALEVKEKGKKAERWWTSGMENCFMPNPSPDEKYVAYIAEMNGVVVLVPPGK